MPSPGLDLIMSVLLARRNSLTYSVEGSAGWLGSWGSSGGKGGWRIRSGCYWYDRSTLPDVLLDAEPPACSCFNAFSRVDVRVEVKIPGGVEAYLIDLRGERHEPTPAIWTETFVSAILRAVLYADDPAYRLAGFRKLDPISTPENEQRFLKAAEDVFFRGWLLGSDPEVQVATVVSNHLVSGIMRYFGEGFRCAIVPHCSRDATLTFDNQMGPRCQPFRKALRQGDGSLGPPRPSLHRHEYA